MLKKLLKYDIMGIFRLWWILAVTALGLSLIGSLCLRILLTGANIPVLILILAGVGLFVTVLGVLALPTVTAIMCYLRFYKNFYTDEGYLTFTLPVKRRTLFFEKVLNTLIWNTLNVLVLFLCLQFFFVISPEPSSGAPITFEVYRSFFSALGDLFDLMGNYAFWLIPWTIELIACVVMASVFSDCLIYFSVTVGAILAKKAKILAGIGVWYGLTTALQVVGALLSALIPIVMIPGLSVLIRNVSVGDTESCLLLTFIGVMALSLAGTLMIVMYQWTERLIERKLNLP